MVARPEPLRRGGASWSRRAGRIRRPSRAAGRDGPAGPAGSTGAQGSAGPQGAAGAAYGLSAVASGLAAGTYDFAFCGSSSSAANWNSNEWAYTSAIVFGSGGGSPSATGVTAAGAESQVDQSPVDR